MKYCSNCGSPINDGDNVCSNCGNKVTITSKENNQRSNDSTEVKSYEKASSLQESQVSKDTGSPWWAVLGFFIPLVGFILFLVWRTTQPNNAKSSGFGALISVVWEIVFSITISIVATIAAV